MRIKLNLGCGLDYRYDSEWVNYDVTHPANVIGDLEDGLPFKSASFQLVWASHILEHIQDLRKLQSELARVIKPGGLLKAICPRYDSPDAWGDPTHCRGISEETFLPVYWAGFNLIQMETKHLQKNPLKDGVKWIFAALSRNKVPYSRVKSELGGHNYTKTAGVPWALGRE